MTLTNNVLNSHLNEDGDRVLDFPITRAECVGGLKEFVEEASTFKVFNGGTLETIGILPIEEGGNVDG